MGKVQNGRTPKQAIGSFLPPKVPKQFAKGGTVGRCFAFGGTLEEDTRSIGAAQTVNNDALNSLISNTAAMPSSGRVAGMAGVNPYEGNAGTTTGLSGAVHQSSTDAGTAQQQLQSQTASESGTQKQEQKIASPAYDPMENMRSLGNKFAPGSGAGAGANFGWTTQTAPEKAALVAQQRLAQRQRQQTKHDFKDYSQQQGFASGGVVDKLREAITGEKEPPAEPPRSTTIVIRGRSDDVQQPAFAKGGAIKSVAIVVPPPVVPQVAPNQQLAQGIAPAINDPRQEALPAEGGMIEGPGTPTSDSIQAVVRETKEPIAVSTGERIVSKKQDKFLQKVAKGMGFKDLDAMLEHGTGKPVGPTIKGGMAHAASGTGIDDELIKKAVANSQFDPSLSNVPPATMAGTSTPEAKPVQEKPVESWLDSATKQVAESGNRGIGSNGSFQMPKGFIAENSAVALAKDRRYNAPTSVPIMEPQEAAKKLAIMQEQQKKEQAAKGESKPAATPPTSPTTLDTRLSTDSLGYNHGAPMPETRFVANEQQIATPSGAIQGKSSADATQMKAPQGGGFITNKAGKAMSIAGGETPYIGADGNPTGDWRKTQDYADAIARNESNKALLAQMQRERLQRDMGPDITSQGTRIAAQQQLAQMDKDQAMRLLAQRGQREDAMSGLDQQLKGQQIAQIAEDNNLFNKAAAGDPDAMKKWSLKHQPKPQAPIAVGGGRVKNAITGDETTEPDVIYDPNTKTFISQTAAQKKTFTKADVDAAIKAGASKEAVAKRVAELGGDPKALGL